MQPPSSAASKAGGGSSQFRQCVLTTVESRSDRTQAEMIRQHLGSKGLSGASPAKAPMPGRVALTDPAPLFIHLGRADPAPQSAGGSVCSTQKCRSSQVACGDPMGERVEPRPHAIAARSTAHARVPSEQASVRTRWHGSTVRLIVRTAFRRLVLIVSRTSCHLLLFALVGFSRREGITGRPTRVHGSRQTMVRRIARAAHSRGAIASGRLDVLGLQVDDDRQQE